MSYNNNIIFHRSERHDSGRVNLSRNSIAIFIVIPKTTNGNIITNSGSTDGYLFDVSCSNVLTNFLCAFLHLKFEKRVWKLDLWIIWYNNNIINGKHEIDDSQKQQNTLYGLYRYNTKMCSISGVRRGRTGALAAAPLRPTCAFRSNRMACVSVDISVIHCPSVARPRSSFPSRFASVTVVTAINAVTAPPGVSSTYEFLS